MCYIYRVPFNISTVPRFELKQASLGDIKIFCHPKEPWIFYLHRNNKQLMLLDFKTNREIREMYSAYDLAYGDVLLSGLGFGILPLWIASKPEVKSVTVVEFSQDIIDIFLQSNTLPDNVNIICSDIKLYKTNDKYDCVILDHYPDLMPDSELDLVFEETKYIASNIPNHDLMWIWPIEYIYMYKYFGTTWSDLMQSTLSFNDASLHWNEFVASIDIPTLPNISSDKVKEYVYSYSI